MSVDFPGSVDGPRPVQALGKAPLTVGRQQVGHSLAADLTAEI